jgi:Domain of unknown function DUF11
LIRLRAGRVATLLTTALTASMLIGVGAATAAPPQWVMTVDRLPATVSPGADAGYRVTITNNGPSNIASLFLVSDQTVAPSYISAPSQGTCNATGLLSCAFGALGAKQSVVVTVAYKTPGAGNAFGVTFQANTTGATFSDTKGRSHGDTLFADPKVTSTALSASPDFAGGFAVSATSYANVQAVDRRNPQATSIEAFQSLIPVMIRDGITSGVACTIGACSGAFGQWSALSVAEGAPFGSPFKVTLLLWGGAVPGGTSANEIFVLHTPDVGPTYVIDQACSPATGTPANAECLTATKVGSNYRIEVWLFQNGSIRGGI